MAELNVQPAGGDSYIFQNSPTDNFSTQPAITLGCYSTQKIRGILKFDVSSITAGSSINSATLSLYYYSKVNESSGWAIDVCRCTRTNWVTNQVTWNIYSTGNNWTTAGGDYTVTGQATLNVPAGYGWMNWNAKALIEDAIANRGGILHIIVHYNSEATTNFKQVNYYSSDYTGDTSLRPKLYVAYSLAGWSNISKLNGVAAASIAKYNGVAVASVAKINGVAV